MPTNALHWTTTPPTTDGFYWTEDRHGYHTIVQYHAADGLFSEMGHTHESHHLSPWVRFSDHPIALPGDAHDTSAPETPSPSDTPEGRQKAMALCDTLLRTIAREREQANLEPHHVWGALHLALGVATIQSFAAETPPEELVQVTLRAVEGVLRQFLTFEQVLRDREE